jgi:ribosome recycling factor
MKYQVRDMSEKEHAKRRQLERALRDASSVFKKELWDKSDELHQLQAELRALRDVQAKSIESFVHSMMGGQENKVREGGDGWIGAVRGTEG